MSRESRLLLQLSAAVADRETVDWKALEEDTGGPSPPAIASLRLVDRLASSPGLERRSRPTASSYADRLPRFIKALILLAGLQLVLAFAGFVVAAPGARGFPQLMMLLTASAFVAGALILVLSGGSDSRTRPLAGFFVVNASAQAQPLIRLLTETLPPIEALQWARAFLPECFIPYFLWRFVREFPRILHLDRWSRTIDRAMTVSFWAGLTLFLVNALNRLFPGLELSGNSGLSVLLRSGRGPYWLVLLGLMAFALVAAWLRARRGPPSERHRVRFFVISFSIGLLPLLTIVFGESLSSRFHAFLEASNHRQVSNIIVFGSLLLMPFSTAYAVRAHRILELRIVLHRALRLALARASAALLAIVPWLVFAWKVWQDRRLPVGEILAGPPSTWLLLGASTGTLYLFRKPLLIRLETALLGNKADAGSVFSNFSRSASVVESQKELPALLDDAGRKLLRATEARLVLIGSPSGRFVTPCGAALYDPQATAIPCLLEASHSPLSLDPRDRDSLAPWLPAPDRQWVSTENILLMAPVYSPPGTAAGFLAVGPARTGLPYSEEDRRAAAALGAAIGLVLDRLGAAPSTAAGSFAPAGECRRCGEVRVSSVGLCACGRPFTEAVLPWEVAGKFRLASILGQGGMGLVYKATDLTLGRTVALKTLPRLDSGATRRLKLEARSMAKLIHPNLALIFGAEVWRGVPILVVEYLAGGTLEARIGQPLAARETLEYGVKLAGALSAMHDEGLLHRDIKPSNIGFTGQGDVKLLDFGLVRIVEKTGETVRSRDEVPIHVDEPSVLTATGHIVGTPLFLSPETLAGEPASPAQDLWSLHLVLWMCLAGHHPFDALSKAKAIESLRGGRIDSVVRHRRDCPRPAAAVIDAGLSPDVRHRPRDAAAARTRFQQAIEALA